MCFGFNLVGKTVRKPSSQQAQLPASLPSDKTVRPPGETPGKAGHGYRLQLRTEQSSIRAAARHQKQRCRRDRGQSQTLLSLYQCSRGVARGGLSSGPAQGSPTQSGARRSATREAQPPVGRASG